MLTKEHLLARLPRTSGGTLKGQDQSREILRLLSSYKYTEKELRLFAAEIQDLVERYGHEGYFVLKKNRKEVIAL